MAMAWLGEVDNSLGYKERLALIKERAAGLGEPARSAFMWLPDATEVHKADISYWITQPWDNRGGRISLIGDAAHPMPPCKSSTIHRGFLYTYLFLEFSDMRHPTDRGQGLNNGISDVWHFSRELKAALGDESAAFTLAEAVSNYEKEMIPRGADEVRCSVENGLLLHDWNKIQASPVFQRGFKPMDGHGSAATAPAVANAPEREMGEHAKVQLRRDAGSTPGMAVSPA